MPSHSNVISLPQRRANQRLRRPGILIRAARLGQAGWRRERDLPRLLGRDQCPAPMQALARLRHEEACLESARKARAAGYSPRRHVLVMIAILAEMRAAAAALSVPGTAIPARP